MAVTGYSRLTSNVSHSKDKGEANAVGDDRFESNWGAHGSSRGAEGPRACCPRSANEINLRERSEALHRASSCEAGFAYKVLSAMQREFADHPEKSTKLEMRRPMSTFRRSVAKAWT